MTGIWRKCLAHWDKCRQKGQILVFTAVLLPLLIAACGFTVDFGNMYMHKSKLQNAADAAAISGAYAYRDYKYTYVKDAIADGKYVKLDHDVDLSLDEKLSGIMAGVNSYQGKEYNWSNGTDISDIAYFYGKNYIYNKSGTNPELKITSQLPAPQTNLLFM